MVSTLVAEEKPAKSVTAKEAFAPKGPLTLEQCFDLSVMRSETLGMREEEIKVAEARYWQAISSILPRVTGVVQEGIRNKGGSFSVQPAGSGSSTASRQDNFEARISVTQPLFTGFRDFNELSARKGETEARRFDKARAYEILYLNVAEAFYQIRSYEQDLSVLGELKDTLEKRLTELDRRLTLGRSREGELWVARSDLAQARVTVEETRGLLGATREWLAFLTGVPADQLKLKDTSMRGSPEALENYLKETGERKDVLAMVQDARAARKRIAVAQGERFGTAALTGNYYIFNDPETTRDWNVFLTYEIPLFDGFAVEARVKEQKAYARISQLSLEQLQRTADREVRTAYNDFNAAVAQEIQLNEQSTITGETYRVLDEDFKLGRASNLDAMDALRRVYDAKRTLVRARFLSQINLIRLHIAAGRELAARK